MNKKLSFTYQGFQISGEFLSDRTAYHFTVWEVVEVSTGRSFEDLDAANDAADDVLLQESPVSFAAGIEAGLDYLTLCDMENRFSWRAYRESVL